MSLRSGSAEISSSDHPSDLRFGALRLIFATLVILSHSPAMIGREVARHQLLDVFGSMNTGFLAVNCFFLISGYLLAGSFARSPSAGEFLAKRFVRIYPGFLVNFAVCVFVVAPLGGVDWGHWQRSGWDIAADAFLLHMPFIGPVFAGTDDPTLNGATWTIAPEFRCYLLMAFLGSMGFVRCRRALPAITSLLLLAVALTAGAVWQLRLPALFMAGACYYVFRDRIRWNSRIAIASALIWMGSLPFLGPSSVATASCGGYLIIVTARWASTSWLGQINEKTDISYGVYLYAWPVGKLLVCFRPGISLAWLDAGTFLCSLALGWISWIVVEQPAMKLAKRGIRAAHNIRHVREANRRSPASRLPA